MVEYRHTFSNALAEGLWRLYRHGASVNIKHLNLTRNQWDNFQKLRYWGLVEKSRENDGQRIGGEWRITAAGRAFVLGQTEIQRCVWTYRGERVRYEGATVQFRNFHEGYKKRPDYAREAKPRRGDPPEQQQETLF